jgi:hypothetical protein
MGGKKKTLKEKARTQMKKKSRMMIVKRHRRQQGSRSALRQDIEKHRGARPGARQVGKVDTLDRSE